MSREPHHSFEKEAHEHVRVQEKSLRLQPHGPVREQLGHDHGKKQSRAPVFLKVKVDKLKRPRLLLQWPPLEQSLPERLDPLRLAPEECPSSVL